MHFNTYLLFNDTFKEDEIEILLSNLTCHHTCPKNGEIVKKKWFTSCCMIIPQTFDQRLNSIYFEKFSLFKATPFDFF